MENLIIGPFVWDLNLEAPELTLLIYLWYQSQNGQKTYQCRSKKMFTKLKIPRTRFFAAVKLLKALNIIEAVQTQGEDLKVQFLPVYDWGRLPPAIERVGTRV
jgi:hypothetical protein